MNRKFAVFILTHGRANNVITTKTLREQGYTGRIFYIVDNFDNQIGEYNKNFGKKNVIVFDKNYAISITDAEDNFKDYRAVVYARNMCHKIAKDLKLTHFLELDDDYTMFDVRFENNGKMGWRKIKNLDKLFDKVLDYLDNTQCKTIAFAQGGDYIGGVNSSLKDGLKRKAMNTFFVELIGRLDFMGK